MPAGGCSTTTGRPKPAALALAPTLQPTAVWFVDEGLNGLDVHVANDGTEQLEGTLTVGLLREDGSVVESADVEVGVPAHSHLVVGSTRCSAGSPTRRTPTASARRNTPRSWPGWWPRGPSARRSGRCH